MLVRTDNTAAVSYINRLGGLRLHHMSQLARHLLLWSHMQLKSLRTVNIPGELNRSADVLSRQLTFPGEWRLHPETIRLIWSRFREAQVDLFAPRKSSHCQLYSLYSSHGRTGTQLALDFTQVCVSPSEPARTDTVHGLGGRGAGPAGRAILAHSDLIPRTHSPRDSPFLVHSSEEGPPFLGARHHIAPASRSVEPSCVAPGRNAADWSGLPQTVIELLDSVELKFLSTKTALVTALTSIKGVGDLQAFSVSEECLVFLPANSHVVLRPRPGYMPKVPTTPFCDQVVNLQALSLEEADPALALLCPIRA